METLTHQSVEQRIATDLAPFDTLAARLAKVQEEYRGLKINGPNDKDGYKMVHAAWQNLKDTRLEAKKLHTALKADALAYGRACDARYNQIVEALKPMEDDFYDQWKAEDTRKEREAEEARKAAEAAIAARLEERKRNMFTIGLSFNGQAYVSTFAHIQGITEAQVAGLDDGPWSELFNATSKSVHEAKEEAARQAEMLRKQQADDEVKRQEEERKQREERERLEAIQAENDRKERELKAREDAMNAKLQDARVNELRAIGDTTADRLNLHILTDEQFGELKKEVAKDIERVKAEKEAADAKAEKERQEREAREAKEREEREARIAKEAAERERIRIEEEARQKQEAEEERIRQAGDVGAIEAMLRHLDDMPWPTELKSNIARFTLDRVRKYVDDARANLNGTIKDLK